VWQRRLNGAADAIAARVVAVEDLRRVGGLHSAGLTMGHGCHSAKLKVCGWDSLRIEPVSTRDSAPATTARYAHLAADPLKQANDIIGARIAAAMSGRGRDGAEVVPLKRSS
jgi:hypothetical protein